MEILDLPGFLFAVEEYRLENGIVEDSVNMLSVLNLGRGLGMEDREAQRVIQV